ncbi:GNAT family N-acetyltransferase [Aquimarina rhabdastrellae]
MNDVALEITDNEFLRQFETTINGEKVLIEYSQQERKIFLTKLIMSDSLIEQGFHEDFMKAVFNLIQERNTRLVPTSPTIAKFVRKNKRKYKDLLPVGIAI